MIVAPEAPVDLVDEDRTTVRLTRYRGPEPPRPVVLAPGFGVRASSFAPRSLPENLVAHLVRAGFDVWLLDTRASPALASSRAPFTIDDIARRDWPRALAEVRARTGDAPVRVVAHCVGSMTLLMALVDGALPVGWVDRAVCSQLGLHPVPEWDNLLKSRLRVSSVLQALGLRTSRPDLDPGPVSTVVNALLCSNPTLRGERCHNPVCWWVFTIFGPSFRHDQLTAATHDEIGDMFGEIAARGFDQLSACVRAGHAVDARGADVYLPGLPRLAELPLLFLSGTRNREFVPASTAATVRALRRANPGGPHERLLLDGFGHMDCFIGRDAARHVFPPVLDFLR